MYWRLGPISIATILCSDSYTRFPLTSCPRYGGGSCKLIHGLSLAPRSDRAIRALFAGSRVQYWSRLYLFGSAPGLS